jgi:hypothetical protein
MKMASAQAIPWIYIITEDITKIYITQRDRTKHEVLIDTIDLPIVLGYALSMCKRRKTWYVQITINGIQYLLHRVLMDVWDPVIRVDHRDQNGLNNRRNNIRLATDIENKQNLSIYKNNISGVPGVTLYTRTNKWKVQVNVNGHANCLGYFTDFDEAVAVVKEFRRKNCPFSQEASEK